MDNNKLVSVVMPVYNCELYLKDAINSILSQTYSFFELIIIDDNSSDNTISIIDQLCDPRIKLIKNDINIGAGGSINKGLSHCNGDFIAIMHGDDISEKNRFSKQICYFVKNPQIDILGTQYLKINNQGKLLSKSKSHLPLNEEVIKYSMLFNNCICHSSVMFRKTIFNNKIGYNPSSRLNEDYEFWIELINCGCKINNLPFVGVFYRFHNTQVSNVRAIEELLLFQKLRYNYRKRFNAKINFLLNSIENINISLILDVAQMVKLLGFKKDISQVFYNKILFFIHETIKKTKNQKIEILIIYIKFIWIAGIKNFKIKIILRSLINLLR